MDGIVSTLADAPAPFLAYFHLLPPHQPYCPRREFVGAFDDGWQPAPKDARFFSQKVPEKRLGLLRQQYDEFIGYVDAELGRLLAMLAQNGQLDNTIVVVTSDHGELFERGIHGHETETLYAPVVHVPLLISLPGQAQRHDVYTPTSCIDLLPTLLHLAGRPIPDWCEGTILPNFSPQKVAEGRSLFALEAKRNRKQLALTRYTVALRQGEFMLTHYVGYRQVDDAFELYDLASDPEQRRDLYPDRPAILSSLRDEIRARLDEANKPYGAHAG